jgi:hypothetical protein
MCLTSLRSDFALRAAMKPGAGVVFVPAMSNERKKEDSMRDLKLGQLITDENAKRDAIHIAVAPVIAGANLKPGHPVALNLEGKAVPTFYEATIGIVDPFLTENVGRGERFWLYLYPNTVTSLRHEWTHPAFPNNAKTITTAQHNLSGVWLQQYASRLGVSLTEIIHATKSGSGFVGNDIEDPSDVPDEFWEHYRIYTGEDIAPSKRWEFFRCAR